MQKRRVTTLVIGAVLCFGALAAAQDEPPVTTQAHKVASNPERPLFAYNVTMTLNGVVVRADRAVIQGSEVTLDGNVRMTFPEPFDTTAALRKRVTPGVAPVPPPPSSPPAPKQVDRPIPQPWQPPPGNQR